MRQTPAIVRRALLVSALAVPLAATRGHAQDPDELAHGRPAVAATNTGSGVIIVSHGVILTAAHVVAGCGTLSVQREGEASVPAVVLGVDSSADLALLETAPGFDTAAVLRATDAPPQLGEPVFAMGFPLPGMLGTGLTFDGGMVTARHGLADEGRTFQMSAATQPGESGGPVVDRSGALLGIAVAQLDPEHMLQVTGDLPQQVNFAVQPAVILAFLHAQGLTPATRPRGPARDPMELAAAGQRLTVLVTCTAVAR